MITPSSTIALIGFGAVGRQLGSVLAACGYGVCAYDALLDANDTRAAMQAAMEMAGVSVALSLQDATRGAKLVIVAGDAAAGFNAMVRSSGWTPVPGQELLEASCVEQALSALEINTATGIAYDQGHIRRGELP